MWFHSFQSFLRISFCLLLFSVVILLLSSVDDEKVPTFKVPSEIANEVRSWNDTPSALVFDTASLSFSDPGRLINLTNFEFSIRGVPCEDDPSFDSFLLVFVHSSPCHWNERMTIRSTWSRCNESVKVIFLLGTMDDAVTQYKIARESETYNDIVQGNFFDSYKNLTYKHAMGFKWIAYHCKSAKYVLKTDDDTFVNMPYLLTFLMEKISPYGARKLILCFEYPNSFVKRSYRSKWRVSMLEYKHRKYPPYCAGFGVIYSPDVVFELYKRAQNSAYFWIDDVFITGILTSQSGLTVTSIEDLILTDSKFDATLHGYAAHGFQFIFGPPNLSISKIVDMWTLVQNFFKLPNSKICY